MEVKGGGRAGKWGGGKTLVERGRMRGGGGGRRVEVGYKEKGRRGEGSEREEVVV